MQVRKRRLCFRASYWGGSVVMKIMYVTSECAPFVKTGGLGDVAGSLPKALAAKGHDVRVFCPLYSAIGQEWREKFYYLKNAYVRLGWRNQYCGIFRYEADGVTYYFIPAARFTASMTMRNALPTTPRRCLRCCPIWTGVRTLSTATTGRPHSYRFTIT